MFFFETPDTVERQGSVETRPDTVERPQVEKYLCKAMRAISLDMLMIDEGSDLRGRHLTPDARAVIANVRRFFAQLKEHLGTTARGTVLESVIAITATACGVSDKAVERVINSPAGPAIRRSAPKSRSRKAAERTS